MGNYAATKVIINITSNQYVTVSGGTGNDEITINGGSSTGTHTLSGASSK